MKLVALTYDPTTRRVLVATHNRTPDTGERDRMLPTVEERPGEPPASVVARALTTVGVDEVPTALGHLSPTTMWATFWADQAIWTADTRWVPADRKRSLAFDHTTVIVDARTVLAERLWHDRVFTHGITGGHFTTADAVALTKGFGGTEVTDSDVERDLRRIDGLVDVGPAPDAGGPAPTLWRWTI
ncbi:NUDIX hydrolase [Gordonia sp. NPDC003376]